MEKRLDSTDDELRSLFEAKNKVWGVALTLTVLIPLVTTIFGTVVSKLIK